jgi:hypothetical protein
MDGERNLSALGGQQLARIHSLIRGGCLLDQLSKNPVVAWLPSAPNFVTAKGIKHISGHFRTPSEYLSSLFCSERLRAASGDGEARTA